MKQTNALIIALTLVAASACTSVKPPESMLSATQSSVDQAKLVGATEHAPLELNNAEDNLAKAERAMEEKEYEEAELYMERAQADAELAITKTNAEKSRKAAGEVRESLQLLQN